MKRLSLSLVPLAFLHRGRWIDSPWDEEWSYESETAAAAAAEAWDGHGEPSGWVRHLQGGRVRHRPDGDPAKEYVTYESPTATSAKDLDIERISRARDHLK